MYVCVCKGVTEKQIKQAQEEGVSDYRSLREKTGVGTQCGKCSGDAKSCFRKTLGIQVD